jgi:hypothetical protein
LALYQVLAVEVQLVVEDLVAFNAVDLPEALVQLPATDAEALTTSAVIARLRPSNATHVGN